MIILASDTSGKSISVAVTENEEEIISYTGDKGLKHSTVHMPLVVELLEKTGISFNDIDLYACTTGPGSYTGIRIGLAATKAMAYAAKKQAIGISTLEVLAYGHKNKSRIVCPVLDARNARVFASAYLLNETLIGQGNYSIDVFTGLLQKCFTTCNKPESVIFCGDAADICRENDSLIQMVKTFGMNIEFELSYPKAVDLAEIAYKKVSASKEDYSPFNLKANYISPSGAQRKLEKKDSGNNDL